VDAAVEHAVSGADDGAVIDGIREIDARREVLILLRDATGLGPIRIDAVGLRQPALFVAEAVAEGQLLRQLPHVLRVEIDIAGAKALDGIAEG